MTPATPTTRDAPIQIYDDVATELLPGIAAEILERYAASTSSYPSLNQGGWKSGEDLFDWRDAPSIAALRTVIGEHIGLDEIKRRRVIGWAMLNAGGSFHPTHNHKTAIQTGIYYVTPGDPPTPTIFELAAGDDLEVEARPGRFVLFPGNLWHRVPAYHGTAPRITIAFDVRR